MKFELRKRQVATLLRQKKELSTDELSKQLQVSYMTMHRILKSLKEDGVVKKVHGGAHFVEKNRHIIDERKQQHAEEKNAIAKYVAERYIKSGEVLFIESSALTSFLIDYITVQDITIITNGIEIADTAARKLSLANIMVCPGSLDKRTMSIYGSECIQFIEKYNTNRAFISCSGINESGIGEGDSFLSVVKNAISRQTQSVYVLATADLFDKKTLVDCVSIKNIQSIICDFTTDDETVKKYSKYTHVQKVERG